MTIILRLPYINSGCSVKISDIIYYDLQIVIDILPYLSHAHNNIAIISTAAAVFKQYIVDVHINRSYITRCNDATIIILRCNIQSRSSKKGPLPHKYISVLANARIAITVFFI